MEEEDLIELLSADNDNELVQTIITATPAHFNQDKFSQYDVNNHKVTNTALRKDKEVFKPTGEKNADGTPEIKKDTVKVNRLPIPMQKLIVRRSAAFLVGGKVTLQASIKNAVQQALYDAVYKVWRDNKLQYKNRTVAKRMMSETECAELWYSVSTMVDGKEVVSLKMTILAPSLGNELHPVFDSTGNMIAFGNKYEVTKATSAGSETKTLYFDLYTSDKLRKYRQGGTIGNWLMYEEKDLPYGKIPVIYYAQDNPEWWDVQRLIERLEDLTSNHADTDDYNGSPILKLKGKVEGMAAKGEAGKAFQMDEKADVDYVTWNSAPESIKLEAENLRSWIFGGAEVPDLSPEFLKSLGDISGAALDRILIAAHLKAQDMQQGFFGECIQRRVNFMIAACVSIDPALAPEAELEITPEYSLFRINDDKERVDIAIAANGGKAVWSRKTATAYTGVVDAQAELDAIDKEEDALGNSVDNIDDPTA